MPKPKTKPLPKGRPVPKAAAAKPKGKLAGGNDNDYSGYRAMSSSSYKPRKLSSTIQQDVPYGYRQPATSGIPRQDRRIASLSPPSLPSRSRYTANTSTSTSANNNNSRSYGYRNPPSSAQRRATGPASQIQDPFRSSNSFGYRNSGHASRTNSGQIAKAVPKMSRMQMAESMDTRNPYAQQKKPNWVSTWIRGMFK